MDPGTDDSQAMMTLWRQLLVAALRHGVSREDAEDLASQAILKGLAAHDPSRGPFRPFCFTIHANLLKNYWRDRKPIEEFDPEMHGATDGRDLLREFLDQKEQEIMREIADRILSRLDPEEAALFLALGDLIPDLGRALVSEAARRAGVSPQKGWDIFRRIQRKAADLREEWEEAVSEPPETEAALPEAMAAPLEEYDARYSLPDAEAPAPPSRRESFDPFLLIASSCATAGFDRFAAGLTPDQRDRLSSLLI